MISTMSDKTKVQVLLEARFQQLAAERKENNEVPHDLRQEVFQTLDRIEEGDDINEVLAGEVKNTATEFIKLVNTSAKENNKPSQEEQ